MRCCLAVHRKHQQRAKAGAKDNVVAAWRNYRIAQDWVSLHQEYRQRKCRINLQLLRIEVMRLVAWRRFGKKLLAWHKYIRAGIIAQRLTRCVIATHEWRCLQDLSQLVADLRAELDQRVTAPMQQVRRTRFLGCVLLDVFSSRLGMQALGEIEALDLKHAAIIKKAIETLLLEHRVAHDSTQLNPPPSTTSLQSAQGFDIESAKEAVDRAYTAFCKLEQVKNFVTAFHDNFTENVLRPLADLEKEYGLDHLEANHPFRARLDAVKKTVRMCDKFKQPSVTTISEFCGFVYRQQQL